MLNVSQFQVPQDKHILRQENHINSGQELMRSIHANMLTLASISADAPLPDMVPMASNPKWADTLFGAVNTVQNSGCLVLTAKLLLDSPAYRELIGREISVKEILDEATSKGYRLWKLSGRSKTLCSPISSVEYLHKEFPNDMEIQSSKTLEAIYKVAGTPVGIGGSMFFLDNLIASVHNDTVDIANDTRIHSVNQIIDNLNHGFPVPLRVNNAAYHCNPCLSEGHYITLYALNDGMATVVDTTVEKDSGICIIPAMRLFNAMVADEKLICAWNARM